MSHSLGHESYHPHLARVCLPIAARERKINGRVFVSNITLFGYCFMRCSSMHIRTTQAAVLISVFYQSLSDLWKLQLAADVGTVIRHWWHETFYNAMFHDTVSSKCDLPHYEHASSKCDDCDDKVPLFKALGIPTAVCLAASREAEVIYNFPHFLFLLVLLVRTLLLLILKTFCSSCYHELQMCSRTWLCAQWTILSLAS